LFGESDSIQLDTYFVYPEELKTVARVQVFRDFVVTRRSAGRPILRMTDMRPARLLAGAGGTIMFYAELTRCALSPSSSGAENSVILLEGDCVGLTGQYLKPGSSGPAFFA